MSRRRASWPSWLPLAAALVLVLGCDDGRDGKDDDPPAGVCTRDANCPDPLTQSCIDGRCTADTTCQYQLFTFDPGFATYNTVTIAGTFNGWSARAWPMDFVAEAGLWYVKRPLPDGRYTYKFVLDDTTWIQDPANPETEPDGLSGHNSVLERICVGCGDPQAFDWRDTVLYFAMVDRFFDSDSFATPVAGVTEGDPRTGSSAQYAGGDLNGVTAKIPYLADLGVTALWLSAPFENRNLAGGSVDPAADSRQYSGYHGYWPSPANTDFSNPLQPNPRPQVESRIGTEADLRTLVDTAHTATSVDGHGIKVLFDYVMHHADVASGLYQAHDDWFARREDRSFALCQTENLWDDPHWGTRCAFTSYLAPFDFYKPEVRAWSVSDAVWWAKEYGIDGYRLDAIKHSPIEWLLELRTRLTRDIPNPAGGRFFLVGETFSYDDPGYIRSFIDPATKLDGQFDFPLKAQACEALLSSVSGLDAFAAWMATNDAFYPAGTVMTPWIGNHDIPRAIHFASREIGNCREGSHAGNGWTTSYTQPADAAPYERLALVFAVLLSGPGMPLIYYGDEVGLAGGGDPDNRRMMPWNDGTLNAHQLGLRATIKKLARIRAEHKVLSRGFRRTLTANADTWVYEVRGCGADFNDILVAINRADDSRGVDLPAGPLLNLMTDQAESGGQVTLGRRSFKIWRRP